MNLWTWSKQAGLTEALPEPCPPQTFKTILLTTSAVTPVRRILSNCLITGKFPEELKMSYIRPLLKKAILDLLNPGNYRPITEEKRVCFLVLQLSIASSLQEDTPCSPSVCLFSLKLFRASISCSETPFISHKMKRYRRLSNSLCPPQLVKILVAVRTD